MREPSDILELFDRASKDGRRMVLATVVDVRGSAYRRPGAHLMVVDDGRRAGSISAGCLESDLLARGESIFESEHPLLLQYDSGEFFGLNYGCDGTILVLVQPVRNMETSFPLAFRQAQSSGRQLGLATIFDCDDKSLLGTQVLFDKHSIVSSSCSGSLTREVSARAHEIIEAGESCVVKFSSIRAKAFCEVISPKARLIIFGAGADARPLIEMTRTLGIEAHIVDIRRSVLEPFKDSATVHQFETCSEPSILVRTPEHTAIVIMSHDFEADKQYLSYSLETNCRFLGVMGSRKRTLKLLKEIEREAEAGRIRFPVGLDIGAETPEEIALSICSEILSVFKGSSGKPLSTIDGPIHVRRGDEEDGSTSTQEKTLEDKPSRPLVCHMGTHHE